jgi:(p)ppGpp synthase/HD superfamily hydrolase
MLGTAIALTAKCFETEVDKGENPYMLHCLFVMNNVDQKDSELMQAAVMHDVIEDTDYTLDDLREFGFSERTIAAVDGVTRRKIGSTLEAYDDFIIRCSENEDSVKIKLADLRHNSDITRLKGLREKDFERLKKYIKAYDFLMNI